MTLTVGELKRELFNYPNDYEVMISVRGEEAWATGINLDVGGVSAWITIDDYPQEKDDARRTEV